MKINWKIVKGVAIAVTVPTVLLASWYVVDRKWIKKQPLFPIFPKDDNQKLAKKVKETMQEKVMKINGVYAIGTRLNTDNKLKPEYYIQVKVAEGKTDEIRKLIPSEIEGVRVVLVEGQQSVAQ